jgi:ribonuclease HII
LIKNNATGSVRDNHKFSMLCEFPIRLPDLNAQKEITFILDIIKRLIAIKELELEKLDQLIKARFVELFGTLNNNENGFDVVTIEDVCSLIKDGTHQTPQYTEDKENGYKFLSSKDVMSQKIDWTDIKYIPAELHEKLYETITSEAIAYSVGIVDHKKIDEINILNATKLAVKIAIEGLKQRPDMIMVDALNNMDTDGIPYMSIIKGDAKCYSIAAASIIAKVTRDRIMREWDSVYPAYGFAKHKGYGTASHIAAIKENGPCSIHRKTFIKNFI